VRPTVSGRRTKAPLVLLSNENNNMTLAAKLNDETKANPNHHLWNNHGTWYVHYTMHGDCTKERKRCSPHTKSVTQARRLRDQLFADLSAKET
jgi:hypothetical protein